VLKGQIRHGLYKPLEQFGTGTRVVKMGLQYSQDRIGHQEMPRVPLTQEEQTRFLVHEGDLLFSRTSMMSDGAGKCSIVEPHDEPFVFDGNILCATANVDAADPRYIYYFFKTARGKRAVSEIIAGTQARSLSSTNLSAVTILCPPLPVQRHIARTLGALDDKIELNRRMSQTLDSMARALFKSWFVDFDPVRAKAEGRDPGLPSEVAELFPTCMASSDVGEIPEGWRVAGMGDVIELAYGKALKSEDRRPGAVAVYGSNGQIGWHDEALARGPGVIVGRKGNPGTVTWATSDFFPIDTTFYVVPKSPQLGLEFLYHALRNHDLAALSADSAVPGLNRNLAYMSRQLIPPASIVEVFNRWVEGLSQRGHGCEREASALGGIRDALLPSLLCLSFTQRGVSAGPIQREIPT
jgi:type I restriction enzyme S subunit